MIKPINSVNNNKIWLNELKVIVKWLNTLLNWN